MKSEEEMRKDREINEELNRLADVIGLITARPTNNSELQARITAEAGRIGVRIDFDDSGRPIAGVEAIREELRQMREQQNPTAMTFDYGSRVAGSAAVNPHSIVPGATSVERPSKPGNSGP